MSNDTKDGENQDFEKKDGEESKSEKELPEGSMLGIWKFEDRLVFIKINNANKIYECRVAE